MSFAACSLLQPLPSLVLRAGHMPGIASTCSLHRWGWTRGRGRGWPDRSHSATTYTCQGPSEARIKIEVAAERQYRDAATFPAHARARMLPRTSKVALRQRMPARHGRDAVSCRQLFSPLHVATLRAVFTDAWEAGKHGSSSCSLALSHCLSLVTWVHDGACSVRYLYLATTNLPQPTFLPPSPHTVYYDNDSRKHHGRL